jgi:amino-acid N-acetyltransferase
MEGAGLLRMRYAAAQLADLAGDQPSRRAIVGEDLTPAHRTVLVADGRPVGSSGPNCGHSALLRSLAVRRDGQGHRLGAALLAHAESQAGVLGVDRLYLLTTTAERFFAARGYAVAPRDAAPPEIQATAEFAGLCPSSSVCMIKRVAP